MLVNEKQEKLYALFSCCKIREKLYALSFQIKALCFMLYPSKFVVMHEILCSQSISSSFVIKHFRFLKNDCKLIYQCRKRYKMYSGQIFASDTYQSCWVCNSFFGAKLVCVTLDSHPFSRFIHNKFIKIYLEMWAWNHLSKCLCPHSV